MNYFEPQQQQQEPPQLYYNPPGAASAMFRAVIFNNEGVRRMERGLYDDAVVSFTNVLETLNPIIPNKRAVRHSSYLSTDTTMSGCDAPASYAPAVCPVSPETSSTNNTASSKACSSFEHPPTAASPLCAPKTSDRIEDEPHHFVFRDPIEIPFDVVPRMAEPTDKLVNKFVVVIMYNLALSVHLSALQCQDIPSLLRAQKLYELAFQMHLEESCDVTLLYSLALMNNLGLIYHILGEEQRSKTCFKNMLATMMYLLESDEAKTIKQWEGLMNNVMDRMFKDHEVAAPAA